MYKLYKVSTIDKTFLRLTILFYLIIYFFNIFFKNFISIDFIVFSIVIIVSLVFFLLKKYFFYHNLIFLFFFSFTLFIFSRVFFHFFGIHSLLDSDSFYWGKINSGAIIKALLISIISFLAIILGSTYNIHNKINDNKISFIKSNSNISKFIIILFLIVIPGTIHKYIFDLFEILKHGYLELYSREHISIAPFFSRVSWYIYSLILPIFFAINFKNKKVLKILIVLIIFLSFVDSLKGSRAALIRPFLFIFWYYFTFLSSKKINIKNLIPLFIFFVFFVVVMGYYRSNASLDINFIEIFDFVFYGQGITFSIIAFYFQFESEIISPSKFYILSPITSPIQYIFDKEVFASGRNFEMLKETYNVDYKLMHAINPDMFFEGRGLGGSYLIELYALAGIFSIFIGSLFFGIFLIWFEKNVFKNTILLILSWYFVNHLVFFSRGNYLMNFFNISLTILIFITIKKIFSRTQ